ncbi:hypothetical protein [Flavobacterium quisquiliarum]|jgi:hypothetical protein|uniref:Addiction module component n=1 Tax=Flavobacterium quisquiliarum TaxID=1834436 RepID=A0ABV8WAZ6_9FLAO|nr:hypothetical protein [Flavobacterium quisquiliarum]MBW1654901.1 hypothetical protein [Flavobacterium quisquiliarum]NWL00322.1 hypothetical protein [Flavobacterium collinsii]
MKRLKKIISVENDSITKTEYKIPKWQITEVRKRTEDYLKNPNNVSSIDEFLEEIERDLNVFK